MVETKRCTKCGRELPLSEFSENVGYRDGYKTHCKECVRKVSREWYVRNRMPANKEYRRLQQEKKDIEMELSQAMEILSGWKMFYIKHPKQGEYSFNAVSTVGDDFKTNSKAEFLQFVQGL